MPAYMIVQIKITREDGWPEYREQVSRLFAAQGGRYLVRGGQVEVLEGSHDGLIPLTELTAPSPFPTHLMPFSGLSVTAFSAGSGTLSSLFPCGVELCRRSLITPTEHEAAPHWSST
jgi:hypothetical protein